MSNDSFRNYLCRNLDSDIVSEWNKNLPIIPSCDILITSPLILTFFVLLFSIPQFVIFLNKKKSDKRCIKILYHIKQLCNISTLITVLTFCFFIPQLELDRIHLFQLISFAIFIFLHMLILWIENSKYLTPSGTYFNFWIISGIIFALRCYNNYSRQKRDDFQGSSHMPKSSKTVIIFDYLILSEISLCIFLSCFSSLAHQTTSDDQGSHERKNNGKFSRISCRFERGKFSGSNQVNNSDAVKCNFCCCGLSASASRRQAEISAKEIFMSSKVEENVQTQQPSSSNSSSWWWSRDNRNSRRHSNNSDSARRVSSSIVPIHTSQCPHAKAANAILDAKRRLYLANVKIIDEKDQPLLPASVASFPSRISFLWYTQIILKGSKITLDLQDMWRLEPRFKSINLYERFEIYEKLYIESQKPTSISQERRRSSLATTWYLASRNSLIDSAFRRESTKSMINPPSARTYSEFDDEFKLIDGESQKDGEKPRRASEGTSLSRSGSGLSTNDIVINIKKTTSKLRRMSSGVGSKNQTQSNLGNVSDENYETSFKKFLDVQAYPKILEPENGKEEQPQTSEVKPQSVLRNNSFRGSTLQTGDIKNTSTRRSVRIREGTQPVFLPGQPENNNEESDKEKPDEKASFDFNLIGKKKSLNNDVSVEYAMANIKSKYCLYKALTRTFGVEFLLSAFMRLAFDIIQLSSPLILKQLLSFFKVVDLKVTANATNIDEASYGSMANIFWHGPFFAILLFVQSNVTTILFGFYFFRMLHIGNSIRTVLIGAINKKILVLSPRGRKNYPTGKIASLVSNDTQIFVNLFTFIHCLWASPLTIIICLVLLWNEIKYAVFASLFVLLLFLPASTVIAKYIKRVHLKQMKETDSRLKTINDAISGIRILKLFAWEPSFLKSLKKIRGEEMKFVKYKSFLESSVAGIFNFVPYVTALATFTAYLLMYGDSEFTPERIFTTLNILNILRFPMYIIPTVINSLLQAINATSRITSFLLEYDLSDDYISHEDTPGVAVVIERGTFAWDRNAEPVLSNITLHFPEDQFTTIVGSVGSGKSSLLYALLGEMECFNGRVNLKYKNIAYIPQMPWIYNATIRDNIIFHRAYRPEKYQRVIEACALVQDFSELVNGDLTEIGEKGVNLSGGQKQRISIARACYADLEIYLMDDPISAVDAHVAKHLLKEVFGKNGILAKRTRIMATHNPVALIHCDRVALLQDGRCLESGTYRQMLQSRTSRLGNFLMNSIKLESDFMKINRSGSNLDDNSAQPSLGFSEDRESRNSEVIDKNDIISKYLKSIEDGANLSNVEEINSEMKRKDNEVYTGSPDREALMIPNEDVCNMANVKDESMNSQRLDSHSSSMKLGGSGQPESPDAAASAEEHVHPGYLCCHIHHRHCIRCYCGQNHVDCAKLEEKPDELFEIQNESFKEETGTNDRKVSLAKMKQLMSIHRESSTKAGSSNTASAIPLNKLEKCTCLDKSKSLALSSISQSEANAQTGGLVEKEKVMEGRIKFSLVKVYFVSSGLYMCCLFFVCIIISQIFSIYGSVWLSKWADEVQKKNLERIALPIDNTTSETHSTEGFLKKIGIYSVFGLIDIVFYILGSSIYTLAHIRGATTLHNRLLDSIFTAPVTFFEKTPLGQILNRLAGDVSTIDNSLRQVFLITTTSFLKSLATILLASIINVWVIIPIAVIMTIYLLLQNFYVKTSRQLKRIEAVTKSPLLSHITETLQGVETIRAFGMTSKYTSIQHRLLDQNNSSTYVVNCGYRWLAVILEGIGNLLVFIVAIFAICTKGNVSSGVVGLVITYLQNLTPTLNWFVRMMSQLEENFLSIERIDEYINIPPEPPWTNEEFKPSQDWPKGEIRFIQFSTKYRKDLPNVLSNINLHIRAGEKVAIVGRTGAGKSSIVQALFRILEPTEGQILIDDVDISKIGLHEIRGRITLIPQDPVLFCGTLRFNIDPFNEHSDEEVKRVLKLSNLSKFLDQNNGGLMMEISEGGSNLAVGQKQLVCLARALLRKSKVLVLDEATASVDMETDKIIQETIKRDFADSTVISIAHRIHTIIGFERIIVLDQGRIAEIGTPDELLNKSDSIFASMAREYSSNNDQAIVK